MNAPRTCLLFALLVGLGSFGCSDVAIFAGDEEAPAPTPDPTRRAVLTPDAVSSTGLCDEESAVVTVVSSGSAALSITEVRVEGEWTVESLELPAVVAPGTTLEITVTTTGPGEGRLILVTDATEGAELSVPLSAE
jgi:hypothetical protein